MKRSSLFPVHPAARRPQRGVALIEVLVSILLFSLGILGLIGLQARAIGFSTDAEDRNRASMLANEITTVMWLNNSVTVPTAQLDAWKERVATAAAGGLPDGEAEVAVTGNSADVTISWNPPTRTDNERSRFITRVVLP